MGKSVNNLLIAILLYSSALAQSVSLSITNQNRALVEEKRSISVNKGINSPDLHDLPVLLDPTSIHVVFQPTSVKLVEQSFIYEPATSHNILMKSVGNSIRLLHPEFGTIQGKLISYKDGTLVVQTAGNELQIIPDHSSSNLVLDKNIEDFTKYFSPPKLSWILDAKSQTKTKVNLTYLTDGLNWTADYTAIVDNEEKMITLASVVNLTNKSGKAFRQATLTLIAGKLNKAGTPTPYPSARAGRIMEMSAKADGPFEERNSSEYHSYHLDKKIDLPNQHVKQLPLFNTASAQTKKSYHYNYQRDPENVSVQFSIENSKKNNLGIPLPEGRVRVYKRKGDQLLILGEDAIANIPKDETFNLEIGKVFDIKAERSVLEQRREGKNTEKLKIAVELRNRKNDNVEIRVVEPLFRHRNAKVLSSNYKVHQQNAEKIEFIVPVDSGKTTTLIFELIYTW